MSTAQLVGETTSSLGMKVLYLLVSVISFFLTAVGLEVDWQYVALAAGASVAGSLVLGYLRREKTLWQQIGKTLIATITGIIVGGAVIEYRGYSSRAYIGLAYFASSLLALILIRTLVSLFETNADSLTVTLIQRVFNVKLDRRGDDGEQLVHKPRRRSRGDVHVTQAAGEKPAVVIDDNAKPDEVRVIEQTVVDKK